MLAWLAAKPRRCNSRIRQKHELLLSCLIIFAPKNNFLQKIWFEICMIHFLFTSNMFFCDKWWWFWDGRLVPMFGWDDQNSMNACSCFWRNLNIFQEVWNLLISMGRYLDNCQERWLYNYTLQRKQIFVPLPKIKYLTQLRVAIENLQNGHVVFSDSKESKSCDLHRSLVTSTSFASMASLKLGKLENTCKTVLVSCDPRSGES